MKNFTITLKNSMMQLICFSILMCFVVPTNTLAQNDNKTPRIKLEVIINGESHQVNDGDTLNYKDNEIIVKTADNVTFDFGIVSFEYPKYYAFEFEEDFAYKNWSLDGNDFVIMYIEIGAPAELDMLIDEMVAEFGKKNCNIKEIKKSIGGVKHDGKRIEVVLFGHMLTYDMFKIKSKDYKSHFIAFQDTKNEDGSDSAESIATMAMIDKTFKIKK